MPLDSRHIIYQSFFDFSVFFKDLKKVVGRLSNIIVSDYRLLIALRVSKYINYLTDL